VTKHDFIFSNQRRYRLTRHITFWLVWCLTFNILFHFPIHVYKGWDVSGPGSKNLQELGLPLFFIKSFIVNSLLGVIAPQIALTYVLIYWLLPNYFYKRKNYFLVGAITVCVLLIFYFVAVGFKHAPSIYNKIFGTTPAGSNFYVIQRAVIIDQLSSMPIILGFALMIKFVKRWWQKQKETELLAKEKTKAELQLLKAQVHPHFLFNTLNNLYYLAYSKSENTTEVIAKLSQMMRYMIYDTNQPKVLLNKEIEYMRNYISLERLRLNDQIPIKFDVTGDTENVWISPLIFITFLENAFKHGVSNSNPKAWVNIAIRLQGRECIYTVENSRTTDLRDGNEKSGIGLQNVKRRLELSYPGKYKLLTEDTMEKYVVKLNLSIS
jgi:sensor histidine kinase YesM